MTPTTQPRGLIVPALAVGALMAVYLTIRPYGDTEEGLSMAQAFASSNWVLAHVCGAGAIASFAWFTVRLQDVLSAPLTRIARFAACAGTAMVLPYYGAETFGLHAVGTRALAQHSSTGDLTTLELADQIRNQPVAITTFGLGLVLLAVAGVMMALAWQRSRFSQCAWGAWPLGLGMALILPQFYLPPIGRASFGVLCLCTAVVFALTVLRPNAAAARPPAAAQVNHPSSPSSGIEKARLNSAR